jgi:hypothetical protein
MYEKAGWGGKTEAQHHGHTETEQDLQMLGPDGG